MASLPGDIAEFEGCWHLSRVIEDHLAGQTLHAEGQALINPDDGQFVYSEEVTVSVPGQAPMRGTRKYLWRQQDGQVAVYFEDGRYFHSMALGSSEPQDHHDCAPDSYDAVYDFSGWPDWRVIWTVQGPRKSYVMTTHYRRMRKTS